MISGGGTMKHQEDALNSPVEMVVDTPRRFLQQVAQRNIVYGDIKYVVLDETYTMFNHGFGSNLCKFLNPL
jgi:superfamily II DNA/RNA helicase